MHNIYANNNKIEIRFGESPCAFITQELVKTRECHLKLLYNQNTILMRLTYLP